MERPTELLARAMAGIDEFVYVWAYHPDGRSEPLAQSVDAYAYLGAAPGAHVDAVWRELVLPEDLPVYDGAAAAQARGQSGSAEYRLRRPDGRVRHVYDRWRGEVRDDGVAVASGVVSDVSAVKQAEAALREREEIFRQLAIAAPVGIYLADLRGHITFANERWRAIFDLAPAEALEDGWLTRVHPDDRERIERSWDETVERGVELEEEYRLLLPGGLTRWIVSRGGPVRDAEGVVIGFVGTESDITERRATQSALERLTRTDPLTGVGNRRQFGIWLREALLADGTPPAVALLDIDHFKRINDTFGHQTGDAVLVEVARRLVASVRGHGLVARWGGEEFAVVLRQVRDEGDALGIAERLRAAVGASPVRNVPLTASAGVAVAAEVVRTPEGLMHAADQALYAAKRRGRNQTRLASRLTPLDLVPEEPEAVRVAQGLALAASVREGAWESGASRVGDLADEVARRLGLPEPVRMRCRLGGLLRDVGKVALPDAVLLERGALDGEGWRVMRTHCAVGERIVLQNPLLREAAPAVRHHHERWDGTGYPDGLAGTAIPIEARIVAAADAYGAITSDRSWRRALEQDDALAELRASAGTHLDPEVVVALCGAIEDVRRRVSLRGAA